MHNVGRLRSVWSINPAMLARFGTNPTQLAGILAFAAACLACLMAAKRSSRERTGWAAVAVIYALLVIEIIVGMRHGIHDRVVALLRSNGEYAGRTSLQQWLVMAVLLVGIVIFVRFLFTGRRASLRLRTAKGVTIVLLILFGAEIVSLHAIDAVMYTQIGPVLLLGWLWVAAAAGVCVAAMRR